MKCIEAIGKPEFTIEDIYAFKDQLSGLYPENQNVKPIIAPLILGLLRNWSQKGSREWLGTAIITDALAAITNGRTNGPACATMTVGIAGRDTCHRMTPMTSLKL